MAFFDVTQTPIGGTVYVSEPFGWSSCRIHEWTLVRKTPSGILVCERDGHEMRITAKGRISGAGEWSRRRVASPQEAAQIKTENEREERFNALRSAATALEAAARVKDYELIQTALSEVNAAAARLQPTPDYKR